MELILDIDVEITDYLEVKGNYSDAAMLSFTGEASGAYFTGKVIGTGVDTQKRVKGGETLLSARYMLEGSDNTGASCRVFIENNSDRRGGFSPVIVTDSRALSRWEVSPLTAEIIPTEGGVNVRIYITDQ